MLRANNRADRIDVSCPLNLDSFSRTSWASKSFKLPNFLVPRSRVRIVRVVETERYPFSRETNHYTVTCYAYKAGCF
jgi:hypothetical protein